MRELKRIQETQPSRGTLTLEADPKDGRDSPTARLLRDDCSDVIPPLRRARVIAINIRGMRIIGHEIIARRGSAKSRDDYYGQSWIVKPF